MNCSAPAQVKPPSVRYQIKMQDSTCFNVTAKENSNGEIVNWYISLLAMVHA